MATKKSLSIIKCVTVACAIFGGGVPAVAQDRIFGVAAARIPPTLLDPAWRRAIRRPARANDGRWSQMLGQARSLRPIEQIMAVNIWVNQRITYETDAEQYSEADHWAPIGEAIDRARGDCEDYAIAKFQLLRALGFSGDDMAIMVVEDLALGADHAVLRVRLGGADLILDNGIETVRNAEAITNYRPIASLTVNRAWRFGTPRDLTLPASSNAKPGPLVILVSAPAGPGQ